MESPGDITRLLSKIEAGDANVVEHLVPVVYDELRSLARAMMASERPEHTLDSTALVHEAYLRLMVGDAGRRWQNRRHFFSAAAEAMRRILVDSARARRCGKRVSSVGRQPSDLLEQVAGVDMDPDLLLDMTHALDRLAAEDPLAAELAKLRLFAGLSVTDAGETLGLSRSDAYRIWGFAKAWLAVTMDEWQAQACTDREPA